MTIDEAIEHAEERACGNDQCAKDHAQLADWLRELRRAMMEIDLLKTSRDGFKADAQVYMAENAKLRKLIGAYHEYCLCNQYSEKSAHQLITEIEDMIRELGIETWEAWE